MMNNNNNTYSNSSSDVTSPLAKEEELKKFESSFFPAGGSAKLVNIPQAPPAPRNLNNVKSKPMNLKTRNWGPKLENGYGGLNRSLYDRPSSSSWDQRPSSGWAPRPTMNDRSQLNRNVEISSFPSSSSSTSTTSTSRSVIDNIPLAMSAPPKFRDLHNNLVHGKRLRIRNWGYPTAEGWSGSDSQLYSAGMILERDILLNELRYKYGPRPTFQQERSIENIVETVPITTTAFVQTGPTKVFATTVPVPMLNPPINDGRRYAKLYKRNTNALASEKGVANLVKRRGTRRDHLVQPNIPSAPLTSMMTATPYAGATVIQPATLVSETRTVLPAAGLAPLTSVAPLTTLAPAPSKAQIKREKRALRDQQKFVKKQQKAALKTNKNNAAPVFSAPTFSTAAPVASLFSTAAPVATTTTSYVAPLQTSFIAQPTTTLISPPALQTAAFPTPSTTTLVAETRSVLTQDATILAPTTTTTTTTLAPQVLLGGVTAGPLDHSHVLAGQLGNAPVKRPRRARKAKKGTEQPMYSNIISTTPAPLAAIPTTTGMTTTTSSTMVEGTTVVQPATLVSETRNILVDPLVQQQGLMVKQEYIPAVPASLAVGNPMM